MRIPSQFDDMLEYVFALPFLAEGDISDGLNLVTQKMITRRVPNMDKFARYYRRMWIPLVHIISVFGRRVRTTNICENFHRYAPDYLGHGSPIWQFLRNAFFYKFFDTKLRIIPVF